MNGTMERRMEGEGGGRVGVGVGAGRRSFTSTDKGELRRPSAGATVLPASRPWGGKGMGGKGPGVRTKER